MLKSKQGPGLPDTTGSMVRSLISESRFIPGIKGNIQLLNNMVLVLIWTSPEKSHAVIIEFFALGCREFFVIFLNAVCHQPHMLSEQSLPVCLNIRLKQSTP